MTNSQPHALIIDDEPDIPELLEITLLRMGISCDSAGNVAEAMLQLQQGKYQVCLTDLKLPDGDGIDIVRWIQKNQPELPVAVFTAHGNMDTAIEAMKAGAFDFISKPVELEQLRSLINTALKLSEADADPVIKGSRILGNSDTILRLHKQIAKVARSQAPVYISGESGTGKELVARAIHYQGGRSEAPFIPVNCGAIPKELVESEFFGHKKGSFTGANSDKQGLFQAANGGTLFLDEVAALSLDMQVKLLRALQEKAIRPVGAEQEIAIDVRILSATHKNLADEVSRERFRNDLFYRINVIQIQLPPLRDRTEDIPLLANTFLEKFATEVGFQPPKLSKDALNTLQQYSFPGNVRELENILERAFTLCEDDLICIEDIQLPNASSPTSTTSDSPEIKTSSQTMDDSFESLDEYLEEIEKEVITSTLEKTRWNRTAAAKKLGITFRSFRYRLKKLGLDD
ncbi:MAG: two-component system response regulator PilR [Candidatus Pelagadaptatus aseana]|uniref:sigma-54-dependent transcriptional regulator n=1 Tax=Candidatus Pelagadaptatus aseana TaxID=3120508 RepID=UPI0039B35A5A